MNQEIEPALEQLLKECTFMDEETKRALKESNMDEETEQLVRASLARLIKTKQSLSEWRAEQRLRELTSPSPSVRLKRALFILVPLGMIVLGGAVLALVSLAIAPDNTVLFRLAMAGLFGPLGALYFLILTGFLEKIVMRPMKPNKEMLSPILSSNKGQSALRAQEYEPF